MINDQCVCQTVWTIPDLWYEAMLFSKGELLEQNQEYVGVSVRVMVSYAAYTISVLNSLQISIEVNYRTNISHLVKIKEILDVVVRSLVHAARVIIYVQGCARSRLNAISAMRLAK